MYTYPSQHFLLIFSCSKIMFSKNLLEILKMYISTKLLKVLSKAYYEKFNWKPDGIYLIG